MQPLDVVIQSLDAKRLGWKDQDDQQMADALCELLQEVARARFEHYPPHGDGDGINSWRDQVRMLESDLLDWLIPFVIARFADPACTNQSEIAVRLASRLELYRSLTRKEEMA